MARSSSSLCKWAYARPYACLGYKPTIFRIQLSNVLGLHSSW